MRESARISASIELLHECITAWEAPRGLPADVVIHQYFRSRRYIGSKDRVAIAVIVYFAIRHYAMLSWWAEKHQLFGARALIIGVLILHYNYTANHVESWFDGKDYSAYKLAPEERKFLESLVGQQLVSPKMPDHVRLNYPKWLEPELKTSLGEQWRDELAALNAEAPVDLRTNTLLTTREDLQAALIKEGFNVAPTPFSPVGLRMQERKAVFATNCFKQGWFEMQDEGSQLVCFLPDVKPSQKIIDFCAGAGGKTLALAARMQNKGRILAWDTSSNRLDQMIPRIKRAKADNVQRHLIESENDGFVKRHKNSADLVLIDAPCTGTGTWRRNPDLKWRTTPQGLQEIVELQQRILISASRLVKAQGLLLYVTCSLLESENQSQIETFLAANPNFTVVSQDKMWNNLSQPIKTQGAMFHLTPAQHGTDGFFAALLQRS